MQNKIFKLIFNPRHRPMVLAVIIVGILFYSIICLLLYNFYNDQIAEAKMTSKNISQTVSQHVEEIFEKIDIVLLSVRHDLLHRQKHKDVSGNEYTELLKIKKNLVPEILHLRIIDKNGNTRVDASGALPKHNVAEKEYFIKAKKNSTDDLIFSNPYVGQTAKTWIIVLVRPIIKSNGGFDGLVLASIDLNAFNEYFSKITMGPKSSISIYTSNDLYLLARYPYLEYTYAQIGKKYRLAKQLHEYLDSGYSEGGWRSIAVMDNIDKIFSFKNSPKYRFLASVGIAAQDILMPWYKLTILLLSVVGIASILFVLFLYRYLLSTEEIDLQKLKSMESAKMATLGFLTSGISHEINNPLATIQMQAWRLQKIFKEPSVDVEKAKEYTTVVQDMVERITKIVKGLKIYSRNAEADPFENILLEKDIQSTVDMISSSISSSEIDFQIESIPVVQVSCREAQISQILVNLLNNSVDAIAKLSEKWIRLTFAVKANTIEIIVTDSGRGIPPNIAKKMMEPFFTTKQVGQGTGLGLSISKKIIDDHGGELFLNQKSSNTQFIITLPKI